MGFGMRARSPARRWALTPPFHPYPFGRSVFCATFRGSLRAVVNGHPALWSPDFPPRVSAAIARLTPAILRLAWKIRYEYRQHYRPVLQLSLAAAIEWFAFRSDYVSAV